MKPRTIDHAVLAARVRRDAERYARANLTDDAEFDAMISRDVAAMHAVANLVEAREMNRAYQRASRMDMAARNVFSRVVWEQVAGGAAFGCTEID